MTWNEYLPLAEKTLSTQFHCEEYIYQKILHAVIGSLTEVEEILDNYIDGKLVTDVNKQGSLGEECSDCLWYLSILYRELNIEAELPLDSSSVIDEFDIKSPFDTLVKFTKQNLKFLDLLKKKIYYNKPIDNQLMVDYTNNMFRLLNYYCQIYNTNVADILDKNIQKLRARYGEKFSSERAINRDLEIERTILESK
jgi:NTP pyrophosphatase (non-canonical NTP hydrolase)